MLFVPEETRFDIRWSLLGIPVRVTIWFWVTTILLGVHRGATPDGVLIWTLCVLGSITVHEFGHALTARGFGGREVHVVLYYLGGLAFFQGVHKPARRIAVTLMGPGAQLLLYGALRLVYWLLPEQQLSSTVELAFAMLFAINLFWALANLVPIYPLDGGQIVAVLLGGRAGEARGRERALHVSILTAGLLAVTCIVEMIRPGSIGLPAGFAELPSLSVLLFFVVIIFDNVQRLRVERLMARGAYGGQEEEREPWERPGDWWKR